jgi:hypothetical protein
VAIWLLEAKSAIETIDWWDRNAYRQAPSAISHHLRVLLNLFQQVSRVAAPFTRFNAPQLSATDAPLRGKRAQWKQLIGGIGMVTDRRYPPSAHRSPVLPNLFQEVSLVSGAYQPAQPVSTGFSCERGISTPRNLFQ